MLNFLVETKNEYTTHLINILTPLIFEGLMSIYKEAQQVAGPNDILKIFQSFLKRIPKWNQAIIDKETERIVNSSHSFGWLNDLIKATLKANLVILMYNPSLSTQQKINPSYYQDIKTSDFIHKVYIECAREFWNNPYLMYHNYPPIEIKRNQRDCLSIIKECIKESLRKLLPVKHILQMYLGEELEINNAGNDEFEKVMSDIEERNLTKMIKKDLSTDKPTSGQLDFNYKGDFNSELRASNQQASNALSKLRDSINRTELRGGDKKTPEDIGDRILNIINKDATSENVTLMSSVSSNDTPKHDDSFNGSFNGSTSDDSIKKYEDALKPVGNNSDKSTIDDKIKKILKKDLASDSDLETSLNYSQEENENKYQEIFSNSIKTPQKQEDDKKNKNKFFKKYLAL
jgi:hypothetical protein